MNVDINGFTQWVHLRSRSMQLTPNTIKALKKNALMVRLFSHDSPQGQQLAKVIFRDE